MIVGVLLAAGESRRMKSPKALVRAGGESFVVRGVRHLWSACDVVVVVLGARAATLRSAIEEEFLKLVEQGTLHADLQRAHRSGARELELHFVTNPRWRSGMYGSVRAGLAEALRAKPEAAIVLPVDHPDVKPTTIQALAVMMRQAIASCGKGEARRRFAYALVPRHKRHRGHPVALSPALAAAVAKDAEAEHLSDAIRRNAALVGYLDVADRGVVRNVNRPGD